MAPNSPSAPTNPAQDPAAPDTHILDRNTHSPPPPLPKSRFLDLPPSSPPPPLPQPQPTHGPLLSPSFAQKQPHFAAVVVAGLEPPPSSRNASATPKPRDTPSRPGTSDGVASMLAAPQAGVGHNASPEVNRPLNVTDALSYLDAVKVQFQDKPDVYNHFLDIMKDFKSQVIDTPGVIERVSQLFHGNPYLIQGFNTFLPIGYRIDISADPHDPNMITVTTPMGTTTQNSNSFGQIPRPLDTMSLAAPAGLSAMAAGLPFPTGPSLPPPGAGGSLGRSLTPTTYHLAQLSAGFDPVATGYLSPGPPGFPGAPSTSAAASFLNGLNSRGLVEKQPAGEFNHAIQYLNKIKARYSDDPNTYKQFLEILQTYQKEQRDIQDSQVYAQVQMLFKDAPDLLDEFKDFLPEVMGGAGPQPVAGPGVVDILPHPGAPPDSQAAAWGKPDGAVPTAGERSDKAAKKAPPPSKRRKRAVEEEPAPAPPPLPPKPVASRTKKAKHFHKPEPQSPSFSPYQGPSSPHHVPSQQHAHAHPSSQQAHHSHSHAAQAASSATHGGYPPNMPDELLFFDRAKKALESRETYEEFLKLLNLYTKDVIDTKTLVDRARMFLGDGELLAQFKELMGWDDKATRGEHGPPGSIRTGPPEALAALPAEDGEGPSYRRLPDSEVRLACSGRDELCRSVLNDEWVSHPTWASEESGFVSHKKNTYEEFIHKSEEERHEYHIHLDAMTRTIAILDPINNRIDEMSPEERSTFKLSADFGGTSPSLYHRTIRKVYGKDAGNEVIKALQECPSVSVPVVVHRLKQKDEDWRRAHREWGRTWREVEAKNFYKSLDHQGISFKANDKKNITAKHFVADIEAAKTEQVKARGEDTGLFPLGSTGAQLEYTFQDTSVLHDSLKLVYSFLDHSSAHYSAPERRGVERFLRLFVPLLCMHPVAEFNAACGPLDGDDDMGPESLSDGQRSGRRADAGGVAAGDLRKKLLKTVQEKAAGGRDGRDATSAEASHANTPTPGSPAVSHSDEEGGANSIFQGKLDDIWIREAVTSLPAESSPRSSEPSHASFFANTTFYTLLRLLQLLYSRLLTCKEIGADLAAKQHRPLLANAVAVELGLDDPNGPPAVLAQAMEAIGNFGDVEAPNVIYMYLLDACEKVFDSELDQATFEEHMRWFFGNKAFYVFTLDKLIIAIVKQVQTILSDNKCQRLWTLLQGVRNADKLSNQDKIRYRREAERHLGSDDHLYRIDWYPELKSMRMQLVGPEDPSVDEDHSPLGRWREYVDTYVMRHPTEWAPSTRASKSPFLRRCLPPDSTYTSKASAVGSLAIRVSFGTYKMFYEAGTEECLWRRWDKEQYERAKRRQEERRRSQWVQSGSA